MSRLLVGSVFSGSAAHALNVQWYNLQLKMLRRTLPAGNFDHAVCLSQGQAPGPFTQSKIVFRDPDKQAESGSNHAANLHRLRDYFLQHRDEYSGFLFLDSDAFPFRKRWLQTLLLHMGSRFDMAAITRADNYTWYPHPSACFCLPSALARVDWKVAQGKCMDGSRMRNPGVAMAEQSWLPLLRTNKLNVHPLLCGQYSRLFYHHGAGSRSSQVFYGSKYFAAKNLKDSWRKQLFATPVKFMQQLDW